MGCEDALEDVGNALTQDGLVNLVAAAGIGVAAVALAPFVPLVAGVGLAVIGAGIAIGAPIAEANHDFSTVDDADLRPLDTSAIDRLSGYTPKPFVVGVEPFNTFEEVLEKARSIDPNFLSEGTKLALGWSEVHDQIGNATATFRQGLTRLERDERWAGLTKTAAINNAFRSFREPTAVVHGASGMHTLVDAFAKTMDFVDKSIASNEQKYWNDQNAAPERVTEIRGHYDSYARLVMQQSYQPSIVGIAAHNPPFTAGGADVGGPPPPVVRPPGGGGGGMGLGGDPAAFNPAAFGGPTPPGLGRPAAPDIPPTDPTGPPLNGLGGLTNPAKAAGDAAKSALGQLGDAAKKAAQGAQSPKSQGPPKGVPGPGSKIPGGAKPGGTGGGPKGGGGAGGGGAGQPRLATGKTPGAPAAAAVRPASAAMPQAGLSNMAGTPGPAGAPAAGRPGDSNANHQIFKALKVKKHGEQVIGTTEAVVPVVGAAESDSDESEQEAARRDRAT